MSADNPARASRRAEMPALLNVPPRRGTSLYSHVVDTVGQQVVSGELPADAIIDAEHVCQQLGISRSVVREGMRTLASMGLVESRPQRGTRVLPRTDWNLLDPRVIQWRGEGPEYLEQTHELLELRLGVEHAAASLAARRMSDEGLQAALRAGRAMQKAFQAGDAYAFFRADAELHRLLLEGAGNSVIAQFADTVSVALRIRGSEASRSYSSAQSLDAASADRHLALAEALARRDGKAAQAASDAILLATVAEVEDLLARGCETAVPRTDHRP